MTQAVSQYQTILLSGIPRSGSTLCCHLLNNYENTLALHEPMDISQFKAENGPLQACRQVADFAFQSRKSVLYDARVISKHQQGVIPDNPVSSLAEDHALRQEVVSQGSLSLSRSFSSPFRLIIKHNALFTALIEDLRHFFPFYGVIRNPLAVLASWATVDLPVNRGHIPAGERFAAELKELLGRTDDVLSRQLLILDWFFAQFQHYLPLDHVLRYEDLISDSEVLLSPLSYNTHKEQVGIKLHNKNTNLHYQSIDLSRLYDALMQSEGAYWNFYAKDDVTHLYQQLISKQ